MKINLKLGTIKEPWPEALKSKLKRAFDNANEYPNNYDLLIEKLAKHHNISKDKILLLNGTDSSIDLMVRTLGNKIFYYEPTYYEFWAAPKRNNVKYEALKSEKSEDYVIKTSQFDKNTVLILCNPNNPFGEIPLKQILDFVSKSKGYVVVDEAYIEFSGETPLSVLDKYPNLILMRSFSKTYAMAGLRVGYVIAAPQIIRKLSDCKVFFDVSSASIEAALVALDNHEYFKNKLAQLAERKRKFDDFLESEGYNVIRNKINNTILHFSSEKNSSKFVEYLNKNDIIVNQGNGISTLGLDKSWIRFACGTDEQMQQVIKIIKNYVGEKQ